MSDRTEEVCSHVKDDLLAKKNVVGVAGGDEQVLVFVERKEPLSVLSEEDVVESEVEGVSTDVIEVGELKPMLKPGDSIGLQSGGTGTLGGVVVDELDRYYILTNNHVAANSNRARVLEDIHHPGPADRLGRSIGKLARFEPIYFDRPNYIDAALVALAGEDTEPSQQTETTTARVGWKVQKHGRTTGHTYGEVIGRNAAVNIDFGDQGVARFENQIITDFMLDSGDSGSMLLSRNGHPVGLGFAGSYSISIHNPINLVLRTLGVSFA